MACMHSYSIGFRYLQLRIFRYLAIVNVSGKCYATSKNIVEPICVYMQQTTLNTQTNLFSFVLYFY